MKPLTKTEFAKERGVSRTRVYQWIEDGRIATLQDGRIDADEAHARLNERLDQVKGVRRDGNITSSGPGGPAGAPQGELPVDSGASAADGASKPADPSTKGAASKEESGYWGHRTESEKYEALQKKMRALQTAGVLTSAPAVRKEAAETARRVRNALLAIPDRVASVLDPGNPARAYKLLTGEITRVLGELTGQLHERAQRTLDGGDGGPGGAGAPAAEPRVAVV